MLRFWSFFEMLLWFTYFIYVITIPNVPLSWDSLFERSVRLDDSLVILSLEMKGVIHHSHSGSLLLDFWFWKLIFFSFKMSWALFPFDQVTSGLGCSWIFRQELQGSLEVGSSLFMLHSGIKGIEKFYRGSSGRTSN